MLDAIGAGALTVGDIKSGFRRMRALLRASSGAVGVPGYGSTQDNDDEPPLPFMSVAGQTAMGVAAR
jgi:hypothetical protein